MSAQTDSCIDEKYRFGRTQLMIAAEDGDHAALQRLIRAGASLNLQNDFGQTALHNAVFCRNGALVRTLIKAGAKLDQQTKEGETALHTAAKEHSESFVRPLIDAGAQINLQNTKGETALHYAASHGSFDCVQALIAAGAEIDLQDKYKCSALRRAVMARGVQCLKALIVAGAQIHPEDKRFVIDTLAGTTLRDKDLQFAICCYKAIPKDVSEAIRTNHWSLKDQLSSETRSDTAKALHAMYTVLQSVEERSVVNVHICGEECAGKSVARTALMDAFSSFSFIGPMLFSRVGRIEIETGRTLGMETFSSEISLNGEYVQVLLHDYGGQEVFQANHAPFLRAQHSVYVIVVPLWDMRNCENDKAGILMDKNTIFKNYRKWLRFITTSTESPKIVTVLNFKNLAGSAYAVEVKTEMLRIQEAFVAQVEFAPSQDPVTVLDVEETRTVWNKLVPVIKSVISNFSAEKVPVPKCVTAVLESRSSWPPILWENHVLKNLRDVVEPLLKNESSASATAAATEVWYSSILETLCVILRDALLSSREIVCIEQKEDTERMFLTNPNWLTCELIGGLFCPSGKLSQIRQREREGDYLLDASTILSHVRQLVGCDKTYSAEEDAFLCKCVSKLLVEMGWCMRVTVDKNGFLANQGSLFEITDADEQGYLFPFFATNRIAGDEACIKPGWNHCVKRRFVLKNPETEMFVPGYFVTLYVHIAAMYPGCSVGVWKNGFELSLVRINSPVLLQIVIRDFSEGDFSEEAGFFELEIATFNSPSGSRQAFDVLQEIRSKFIFPAAETYSSFREGRRVELQEHGVHPDSTSADRRGLETLSQLKMDLASDNDAAQGNAAQYYFGMESISNTQTIILLQDIIADLRDQRQLNEARLEEIKQISLSIAAVSSVNGSSLQNLLNNLDALPARLNTLFSGFAGIGDSDGRTDYVKDLKALLKQPDLAAALDAQTSSIGAMITAPIEEMIRSLEIRIDSRNTEKLKDMQRDLEGKFDVILSEMRKQAAFEAVARDAVLSQIEDLASTDSVSACLANAEMLAKMIEAVRVNLHESDICDLDDKIQDTIQRMGASIQAQVSSGFNDIRTFQQNYVNGVYEMPLLVLVSPKPASSVWGAAKRLAMDVYEVHFRCPLCGKVGDTQYKKCIMKKEAAKALQVARWSMKAVSILSCLTPLPLPHLGDVLDLLGASDEATYGALSVIWEASKDALDEFDETAFASDALIEVKKNQDSLTAPESGAPQQERKVLSFTHEDVVGIRRLLVDLGEDFPLQTPGGLIRALRKDSQCVFVCGEACKKAFIDAEDVKTVLKFDVCIE